MPDLYRYYIWARYSGGEERIAALQGLTLYALVGYALGQSSFQAYRMIVDQYFSRRKTAIRPIRKHLEVGWDEALAKRRTAFVRLDGIHDQTMSTVTRHMEIQGLINHGG